MLNMNVTYIAIYSIMIFYWIKHSTSQTTVLDAQFGNIYRWFRHISFNVLGPTSENRRNVQFARKNGKTQRIMDNSERFFCDGKNGPGRRSESPPSSVHRLRPGDIDIIGALGDSLTAGNGIFAATVLEITIENRGIAWSIGGQGNWRKYLTLPNILKEFNPKLYGYSLRDGLSIYRTSKFNVAELGAVSSDIPYEASILVKRMKADSMVNMTHHWKLITILVGNNDFCSDMCYHSNPTVILKAHERNMLRTLRFLRDNVPRLMVNIVPAPNLIFLTKMVGRPLLCESLLTYECPCLIGKDKATLSRFEFIMKKWIGVDSKVACRNEFNTETFTVNIQPFTMFDDLPRTPNGNTDFGNLSVDCFHMSQKGHAACANSLWNNMLEPDGQKSHVWTDAFLNVKCPTRTNPYLYTRSNSFNGTNQVPYFV